MTELRLKKTDEPTIFNKEMALGFFTAGLLAAGTGGFALPIVVFGTLIGGFLGKSRIENERHEGKVVSDKPSFWNKDTFLGGFLGHVAGNLVAGTIIAVAVGTLKITGTMLTTAMASTVAPVAVAAIVAGTLLGAYIGGRHGQKVEREEFAEAAMQQPQVMRQPGYAMEMNPAYAQEIERQRALAAQQGKAL
jgi:hypothetical protein